MEFPDLGFGDFVKQSPEEGYQQSTKEVAAKAINSLLHEKDLALGNQEKEEAKRSLMQKLISFTNSKRNQRNLTPQIRANIEPLTEAIVDYLLEVYEVKNLLTIQ